MRSIAICGSEITIVGRLPIQMVNIPPYFSDSASSWIHGQRLCKSNLFPIIGRGIGPGGILRQSRKSWIVMMVRIHNALRRIVGRVIEERTAFPNVCEDILGVERWRLIAVFEGVNREVGGAIVFLCGFFRGELVRPADASAPEESN